MKKDVTTAVVYFAEGNSIRFAEEGFYDRRGTSLDRLKQKIHEWRRVGGIYYQVGPALPIFYPWHQVTEIIFREGDKR